MPIQNVVTLTSADDETIWIDPSDADHPENWQRIVVQGQDEWVMTEGRTGVLAWANSNWPIDPRKANAKARIKKPIGTQEWMLAMHDAMKLMLGLDVPHFQVRASRDDGTVDGDFTERQPFPVLLTNFAFLYHAELYSDAKKPLSVEVKHDGLERVKLDKINIHLYHIST